MPKCGCCGRKAVVLAPAGWDSKTNRPAYILECAYCAARDGWPWICDNNTMVRDPRTGEKVPYEEWAPTGEDIEELAKHV